MISNYSFRVVLALLCLSVFWVATPSLAHTTDPADAPAAAMARRGKDGHEDKSAPTRPGAIRPKRKPVRKGGVGEITPIKTRPARPAKSLFRPRIFNDPIRFTMTANKDSVAVGEEVEITIRAELLPITSSMMFFFEEQKSFSLKVVMPEGFVQTGGTYFDYIGGTLRQENPVQELIIKGYQTARFKNGICFTLLRGNLNSSATSLFAQKGNLCLHQKETVVNARIATTLPGTFTTTSLGKTPSANLLTGPICNQVDLTYTPSTNTLRICQQITYSKIKYNQLVIN